MLTAGCLKFNAAGRVIVSLTGPVTNFNGGTPTNAAGEVVISTGTPEVVLGGFGYRVTQDICAREIAPSNYSGGMARDSVGRLALAVSEPITHYTAGIPLVADGRVAVAFSVPPPVNDSGFDNGFDSAAFR